MAASRIFLLFICLCHALPFVTSVSADDWPMYRHDRARSGSTAESLEAPFAVEWTYTPIHAPHPAWSGPAERAREGFYQKHRVIFDDAFQVAAVGDTIYFGSSADHKVYALDAATGVTKWEFFTGGPVRLAPTVWRGRVYVGSDDGCVYCLRASDGAVHWKVRGGPNDERLLGNEKMISRWPIRTGVLVTDGIAYFGAGVFPHELVYLWAVDAEDGSIIWKNDTMSQADAGRDEFTPQGYLLASKTRLFVPCGRALPVGFDRTTGGRTFRSSYGWRGEQAGGLIGGTYALLADEQVYTGTQYHLLTLDQSRGKAGFGWFPGRRLAVVGNMAFMADGKEITAMDRSRYAAGTRKRNFLEHKIKTLRASLRAASGDKRRQLQEQLTDTERQLSEHKKQNIEPTVKWRAASDGEAELVICNNIVLVGGLDKVTAFDRDSGAKVCQMDVNGKARGLAVANGRLFVSTDTGKVYCFSSASHEGTPPVDTGPHPTDSPYPRDELTAMYEAAAEAIVMETGITRGYCLVLGAERGRLAWELARRTELKIVGVEPDGEKAAAARKAIGAAGLYGERVVIDEGQLDELPYSNYFANLIVSDSLMLTGKIPGRPQRLVQHLKPCGGTICLGVPANVKTTEEKVYAYRLEQWLQKMELGPAGSSETNGCWTTLVRGELPGAGKWTHQYAESGNTACSDDLRVTGPLGLLWFGEPGPSAMVNRHNAAASPLAVNGRLFIQGENVVMAYDSYNAVPLWKRDIPGAMRTRLKKSECGNLAASEDSLFVAVQDRCLRLDAATGQTRATYRVPDKPNDVHNKWGYLAFSDDTIYGSEMTATGVSKAVFAIDARSGQKLWRYDGRNIVNLTVAVGDGWIFFVDSSLTSEQRNQLLQQDKSHLANLTAEEARRAEEAQKKLDVRLAVALDARTGGKLWDKAIDVTDCSQIGIGGGELSAMYRDGIIVLCGANANGHYWRQFLSGEFSRRRLLALSAQTGQKLWAQDANYRHRPVIIGDTIVAEPWAFDLKTGRQRTRLHPLTDQETTWQFLRPGHHCGAISACPQMLFMRSGYTSYYDLRDDSGIRHFGGHRLGCWINAVCADGLALAPEASAGCVCLFPIICSVALEPRPDRERWGIYSAADSNTPVRHMAVNLGAPGDRRDADGALWFGYPRPGLPGDRATLGFSFEFKVDLVDGGRYFRINEDGDSVAEIDKPWVFASGVRGLKRCVLPLLGETDKPARYTVTLYLANPDGHGPGNPAFDIRLQGKKVASAFDVAGASDHARGMVARRFDNVAVSRDLEIELAPNDGSTASGTDGPALCGIQVFRAESASSP
ncbi:MAG: outer membrane protein assembly factor BamB family protein [Planctomycetota bacterium]|jgi:outer membrane protein assembly factor BamB